MTSRSQLPGTKPSGFRSLGPEVASLASISERPEGGYSPQMRRILAGLLLFGTMIGPLCAVKMPFSTMNGGLRSLFGAKKSDPPPGWTVRQESAKLEKAELI